MLYEQFMGVADELMAARGWSADGGEGMASVDFVRGVSEGFVATARLSTGRGPIRRSGGGSWEGREPPLNAYAFVGVACVAADRVLRAVNARSFTSPAISQDVGDLLTPPSDVRMAIASVEQVRPAVESLVGLVDDHAVPFAAPLASFDALLAALLSDPDDAEDGWAQVPALLMVSGRPDEAREALARYSRTADSPEFRRVSRQLTRLLDGEVTVEELGAAIPVRDSAPPAGERRTRRGAGARARDELAAVEAVRAATGARTREERRQLLLTELQHRDLKQTPVWVEAKLDTLEPGYQQPGTIRALAMIGKLVVDTVRTIHKGEPGEDPAWLAPPDRASYDIALYSHNETTVEIDPEARDWLDTVHSAAGVRGGDIALVAVWLDWATGFERSDRRLAVAIGANRVGLLDAHATQSCAGVMKAAGIRDELPVTTGQLTRRQAAPHYILTISIPTYDHEA